MKERYDFRVREEIASLLFAENEGTRNGAISRKIFLDQSDARFAQLGKLHRIGISDRKNMQPAFFGWCIDRSYSNSELSEAELFQAEIRPTFEPEGESCGTLYDESTACAICGCGARQTSELWLDTSKIPQKKGFAKTIANEWVVSQQVADLFEEKRISGIELREVRHRGRILPKITRWYELGVTSAPVVLSPRTLVGNDPFDDDKTGRFKCPTGHLLGLRVLSEAHVERETWDGSDVVCSKQMVGLRMGVLRPKPLLFFTPRLRKILIENKIARVNYEVAYLV